MIWLLLTIALAAPCVFADDGIAVVLPEGFRGWTCVDFGVAGAPPLPREGGVAVIRPRAGETLKTSDAGPSLPFFWSQAWFEVNGRRQPLPEDFYARRTPGRTDSKSGVVHSCAFFGNEDEADAAGDGPGFEPWGAQGVPAKERGALLALYFATDGEHWTHRAGWLGPPGTECRWHGVECDLAPDEAVTTVEALRLDSNNLTGAIPEEVAKLAYLKRLGISGNKLSGRLPEALMHRWEAGDLEIVAEMPLFSGVTEIDFESRASALLCWSHHIVFRADSSATLYTERCRNATPDDRATFCEVKQGRAWGLEKLARLIEKNGFYALHGKYTANVTDAEFVNTRVVRDGKRTEVVDYAGAGPFELWVVETAIEGVAATVDWEKTTTQPECPRW
jgi:hypothetical protein